MQKLFLGLLENTIEACVKGEEMSFFHDVVFFHFQY